MPQQEQWQLSGNAAELYERYVVPYFLGPWTPELVAVAALRPGERVLDVACGTGVVARLAAPQVGPAGQVTGLDLNPGMLAVARALPPPSGATLTWVECSAMAMDVPDATFEVVLCQQGLQFFPDKPAAVREMKRVLMPNGRVAVASWLSLSELPEFRALNEVAERHVGPISDSRHSFGDGQAMKALLEKRFNEEALSFYSFVERVQGYMQTDDGSQKPLMSAKIKSQEGEAE